MAKIASPPTVLREIDGPEICGSCDTPGLRTELVRDPFIYGAGEDAVELAVEIPVHTCSYCGSYTGEEAADIRHDAVCRHLGLLTPNEIRELRGEYEMSRAAFATLTGLGEATIARWERREVIQNVANDRYLRLLQNPAIFLQLKALAHPEASVDAVRDSVIAVPHVLQLDRAKEYRDRGVGFSLHEHAA